MKQLSCKADIRCVILLIQCTILTSVSATGHNNAEVTIEPFDSFTSKTVNISTTSKVNFRTSVDKILNNMESIDVDKVPVHQITLYIIGVNDNPPKFEFLFYEIEVNENELPGHVLKTVSASDPDTGTGGVFGFTLKAVGQSAGLYDNAFEVLSKDTSGEVKLTKSLDYERLTFYQYDIVATDQDRNHPLSSTASLMIKVLDVQDMPPIFDRQTYEANINENSPSGTKVDVGKQNVTAVDGDHGIPNNISYYITRDSQCSERMTIDAKSGEIFTNTTNLDRDATPFNTSDGICELTVIAKELNTSGTPQYGIDDATASVLIKVNDVNDNPPRFSANSNNAIVEENSTNIVILNGGITVVDDDQDDINTEIVITANCATGPTACHSVKPALSTFTKRGTIELALQNKTFDYDSETYHHATILLTAFNPKNTTSSATASVDIEILDVNDNVPMFSEPSYTANATEDFGNQPTISRNNQNIKTIKAVDKDSGIRGTVTFTLNGGDGLFKILNMNNNMAAIQTNVSTNNYLDRETKDQYTFTVIATDGGGGGSTVQMTVNITDVNDNAPEFTQTFQHISIAENKHRFDGDFRYMATDKDQRNSDNSNVNFKRLNSPALKHYINIDKQNGTLELITPIDYEELNSADGKFVLTVMAYDLGSYSLSTSTSVTIYVQDVNDNAPTLTSENYTMNVAENSKEGTHVGNVFATDKDGTAANNATRFYIDSGEGADKFRINRQTGEINVVRNARIDREKHANYTLSIVVYDTGIPERNDTATVHINVTDVNDEPPTFGETSYSARVNKSAVVNSFIIQCTATDPDLNSDLKYSIIATHPVYTETSLQGESTKGFFNVTDHGEIYLMNTYKRESFSKILLTLKVEDVNGNSRTPQTATTTLTIAVDDSKENPDVSKCTSTLHKEMSDSLLKENHNGVTDTYMYPLVVVCVLLAVTIVIGLVCGFRYKVKLSAATRNENAGADVKEKNLYLNHVVTCAKRPPNTRNETCGKRNTYENFEVEFGQAMVTRQTNQEIRHIQENIDGSIYERLSFVDDINIYDSLETTDF